MTTAVLPERAPPAPSAAPADYDDHIADGYGAATDEPEVGCFLLPLSEFGMAPDRPDLDQWLEAFSARNAECGLFEITAAGELKIMPPTGIPGYWQESEGSVSF